MSSKGGVSAPQRRELRSMNQWGLRPVKTPRSPAVGLEARASGRSYLRRRTSEAVSERSREE